MMASRNDRSVDSTPVRLERREWIGIIAGIALPSVGTLVTIVIAWTTMKNAVNQNTENHEQLAAEVQKADGEFKKFRDEFRAEIRSNHKETIEAISRLAERVRYLEAKVE